MPYLLGHCKVERFDSFIGLYPRGIALTICYVSLSSAVFIIVKTMSKNITDWDYDFAMLKEAYIMDLKLLLLKPIKKKKLL